MLTALYLTEYAEPSSRSARALRTALDLLQGVPTIVVGLFVFGLMVVGHGESGFAGSVALSIVMLPLIARSSQEVLLLVPGTLREAADALGVERWRAILTVVLPAAAGGIVTGAILAVARAAGETAPLLLVDSLFNPNTHAAGDLRPRRSQHPGADLHGVQPRRSPRRLARAWGAAFVLLGLILIANIGARLMLARYRRAELGTVSRTDERTESQPSARTRPGVARSAAAADPRPSPGARRRPTAARGSAPRPRARPFSTSATCRSSTAPSARSAGRR